MTHNGELIMNDKRERMRNAVKILTEYMETYDKKYGHEDCTDTTFIDDVLYGLESALTCKQHDCESSASLACSNVPSELDIVKDKLQEMETLITVLRANIRELYSMRGEDELTAKYCNEILTATEYI